MRSFNKIFGVGAHNTGTSSLCGALNDLGVLCTSWPWERRLELGAKLQKGVYRLDFLEEYQAVTDFPIPCFYKELDQLYPRSKFILTVRNPEKWVESVERHLIATDVEFSRGGMNYIWEEFIFYKQWRFYKDSAMRRFNAHNEDVRQYFRGRSEDLLEFDIEASDKWERLCGFLGVLVPSKRFPWNNKQRNL